MNEPPRRSRVPPPFPALAYLYRPADPSIETAIVEADERWSLPARPANDVDVLLWGRLPLNRRPSARSISYASARELAVRRLRARDRKSTRLNSSHIL